MPKSAIAIPTTETRLLTASPEMQTQGQSITMSFASDYPVDRGKYLEVLDPIGCDLSRVYAGSCPWLWSHDTNKVLGTVEAAWRSGGKHYAKCTPGDNPITAQYLGDIRAGVIAQTSCRYEINDYRTSINPDGREVVLITGWTLLEVSSVSIPADPTTGVGRSFSQVNQGAQTMPTAIRAERDRIKLIQAMGDHYAHRLSGGQQRAVEIVEQAIESGLDEQASRALFADEILSPQRQESISRPLPQNDGRGWNGSTGTLGLSQREQQSYSIGRAIKAAVDGDWRGAEFERDCHMELEKQGLRSQGSLVPLEALRAPMLTSNPAQAGNLIATEHLSGNFIDALRASTFVYELGCTRMDGLQGNISIPRQASVSSLGWVTENTDLPESAPSFDKIALTPKTVGAWTTMSRLMATQGDPGTEALILNDFRNCLAREIDRTAIHGSGVSGQPTGILNTAGIGAVSLGANGGAATWESILQLEREIEQDNALMGTMGFVTSVKAKSKLKGTLKNAVSGADYIWTDGPQGNGEGRLSGYRAMSSTTVRSDLTKGTGTNLSALIFGDWSSLLIATWGALSLEVDPNHDFRKGTIAMRVMLFADMAVRHAESFAAVTDMTTT